MAGGYGEFSSPSSTISFTTKGLVGVIYAKSPPLSGSSTTDTAAAHLEQSSSSAFGFAYLLSAGTRYPVGKRISLLLNLEYLGTNNIKFDDLTQKITTIKASPGGPNSSISQAVTSGYSKQTIGSLNVNIGIGLAL